MNLTSLTSSVYVPQTANNAIIMVFYVHFIIVCFQLQELLFCETCDTVFCTLCTGGTHKPGIAGNNSGNSPTHSGGTDSGNNSPTHQTAVSNTADHTVIPFSIAIKRMSEILIYKANECTAKLDEATEIVNAEIHRLDHNADSAFENVNARFQAALDAIGIHIYCGILRFYVHSVEISGFFCHSDFT